MDKRLFVLVAALITSSIAQAETIQAKILVRFEQCKLLHGHKQSCWGYEPDAETVIIETRRVRFGNLDVEVGRYEADYRTGCPTHLFLEVRKILTPGDVRYEVVGRLRYSNGGADIVEAGAQLESIHSPSIEGDIMQPSCGEPQAGESYGTLPSLGLQKLEVR